MSLNIVELEFLAFKNLELGRVEVNLFFGESVVIVIIDFDDEFVLRRRQVVGLHLLQRFKAAQGN